MQGKDVFISLPTGSGKSFCFYALPLIFDKLRNLPEPKSIVIVLSPLLALMKNQVSSLAKHGVRSMYVTQESDCDDASLQGLLRGSIILYFSVLRLYFVLILGETCYRHQYIKKMWWDLLLMKLILLRSGKNNNVWRYLHRK